ncbi:MULTISPECIES: TolC family protein [unclassified Novosphingobium]|uniref:TolC family protein n=1 Tax=unclassified Novosphingobium TaxID=2644732 RepID=UPI00187F958E|nr:MULTISPECIES: TolC family protein [unclassified Novosphingobium]MCW1384522.1 TolC family protein [Novosphingobium sp. KCTC 2891]QOV96628.1 TolC family protein [Novosphingobium sp. ES2-1]
MRKKFIAPLLALVPGVAAAEPLTFEAAVQRAMQAAPSVQAQQASVQARRSAAVAAGQLPDPTLNAGFDNFPVTGPPAFSLTRESMTMARVGIEQAFPNPAKRAAERSRAAADMAFAESGLAMEQQNVRLETALAWIDLYYGTRRLAQLQALDSSLHDLQATVSARLASGSSRPAMALEPDQLRAAVNDRRSELTADIGRARARLTRYTGVQDADVLGLPPVPTVDRAALVTGLAALPKLQALDAAVGGMKADSSMARAAKRPDWRVSASYGRRNPAYGDMVSLGVSIDLPVFGRKRQDPKIAAAASEETQARFNRVAAERELVASLDSDLADQEMHMARLDNARQVLVPLARRRAELDMASYAAGKLDLGSALLSSLALAEAEVDALSREADVARDAVRIAYTYGGVRP